MMRAAAIVGLALVLAGCSGASASRGSDRPTGIIPTVKVPLWRVHLQGRPEPWTRSLIREASHTPAGRW